MGLGPFRPYNSFLIKHLILLRKLIDIDREGEIDSTEAKGSSL